MKVKMFVYGTLRKGMYNYDLYLKNENSFRSYGYIKGSMYTLKTKVYPAFLPEGHDMILGEIHEVDESTLVDVDKMENCFGESHPDNEYNKIMLDIYDENNQVIDHLPVYVYNMSNPDRAKLLGDIIECHDYVKYITTK